MIKSSIKITRIKSALYIATIIFAYVAAFQLDEYRIYQLSMVWVYAIALLGQNLITGYNGQFSVGQSTFYALGAYFTAIMVSHYGVAYYWTIVPAGVFCFFVGVLFGFCVLRLDGLFLTLATLSLAIATPELLKYFDSLTGGAQGLILDKPSAPLGLAITDDQWIYLIGLTFLVLSVLGNYFLVHSSSGRAIIAVRDNPLAASVSGINLTIYKTLTFGTSAFFCAISGSLTVITVQFVSPDMFGIFLALSFITGIIVGGPASILGSILGAFFIRLVPTYTADISQAAPSVIYGTIIIIMMWFMPQGMAGLLNKLRFNHTSSRNKIF